MSPVLECRISYKIRILYLFYPVAPQLISAIRILIVEFLHHNLKHTQLDSHNKIHTIRHTIIHIQFETQ